MKIKKILRFYFSAESLNRAFDNLIVQKACVAEADGLVTAEELCGVIEEKIRLERLWAYLDGVLSAFSDEDRGTLLNYSAREAKKSEHNAVNKAINKFTRRARNLYRFTEDISVLNNYY